MAASPRHIVPQLLLFSVLFFTTTQAVKRAHVYIINDVHPCLNLTVHCKSKHSDLGSQVLAPGNKFEFSFKPNIFGTTLFFCGMSWQYSTLHWFDIYSGHRDRKHCSLCFWKIRKDGPCRLDYETGRFDICYPWKEPKN
ncbi:hypothetical protein UlMin_010217 [Ulmus minor]